MTKWNAHIKLKPVRERPTDDTAPAIGESIADQVEAQLPAHYFDYEDDDYDWRLDDALTMLREVTGLDGDDGYVTPPAELEMRLNELYDWADRARVWIEPGWVQW